MSYSVYCHTFPDGKKYIGITSQDPEKRWNRGKGYKGQKVYNQIVEDGWDNIKHEILFNGLSKEEAEDQEFYLIRDLNTINNGWNVDVGGSTHCLYLCRELQRMYDTLKRYFRLFPYLDDIVKNSTGFFISEEYDLVKNHIQLSTLFNQIYKDHSGEFNIYEWNDCCRLRHLLWTIAEEVSRKVVI